MNKQELYSILVDLHMVEADKNDTFFNRDSVTTEFLENYSPVFTKHNASVNQFSETYSFYYKQRPEELSEIYQQIIDSLDRVIYVKRGLPMQENNLPATTTTTNGSAEQLQQRSTFGNSDPENSEE